MSFVKETKKDPRRTSGGDPGRDVKADDPAHSLDRLESLTRRVVTISKADIETLEKTKGDDP